MYYYGLCCGLWAFWRLLKGFPGIKSQSLRYILGMLCAARCRLAWAVQHDVPIMALPSRPNCRLLLHLIEEYREWKSQRQAQ